MELWAKLQGDGIDTARTLNSSSTSRLTPNAVKEYTARFKLASHMTCLPVYGRDTIVNVRYKLTGCQNTEHDGTLEWRVDYNNNKCPCKQYEDTLMCCAHIIAAAYALGYNVDVNRYFDHTVHSRHSALTMIESYPLLSHIQRPTVGVVPDSSILPPLPKEKRKAGRPQIRRFKSAAESYGNKSVSAINKVAKRIAKMSASGTKLPHDMQLYGAHDDAGMYT